MKLIKTFTENTKYIKKGDSLWYNSDNDCLEIRDRKDKIKTDILIKNLGEMIVNNSIFEQIKWERDLAIQQLKELGGELGMKTELVRKRIMDKELDVMMKEVTDRMYKEVLNERRQ